MAETKTKLHELLAVEKNYNDQAGKTRSELMKTFQDKKHLFGMKVQTYQDHEPGKEPVTEAQSDIQSTVTDELSKWFAPIFAKALDAGNAVDVANAHAKADVIVEDGTVVLTDVPTTSLLRIEHRLQELHELLVHIPTLDSAKGFKLDPDKGKGIFKAREVRRAKTKKIFRPMIMVPATPQHPAQVKELYEDEPVGEFLDQEWSSLITSAVKADLLDNCDKLMRAIKKARARANSHEIDTSTTSIGEKIFSYLLKPLAEAAK